MPGPKATNRKTQTAAQNSPNRKTKARLQARIDLFQPRNLQNGQEMHMPGSQNRKK